jgi:transaldolase
MFPGFSTDDLKQIAADGEIPVFKHWEGRVANGQIAIDTLLNAAGLATFSEDQSALDARIKRLIQ